MNDKSFFPFSLNRTHRTRTRIHLHLGTEQDLHNWWNFWYNSDLGGRLGGQVKDTHWLIKTVTYFTAKVN